MSTLFAQALEQHQSGNLGEAEVLYEQILARDHKHIGALANLGILHLQRGNQEIGIPLIGRSLEINPGQPFLHMSLGAALQDLRRLEEAVASYERAIIHKPDYFEAYVNRGVALQDLHRLDEAVASYDRAITLRPDFPEVYYNRGIILCDLKRLDEAVASYDRAIVLKPDYAEAYYNRGIALQGLRRLDEAVTSYDRAITLKADFAGAYCNRGVAFQQLGRRDDALASYNLAIALNPDHADAYNNRGNVLTDLKRLDKALASYDLAIALKPDYADAYNNRGNVLQELKRYDEALTNYDKAIAISPRLPYVLGSWLHNKMRCCDWDNFDTACARIAGATKNGTKVSIPFASLAIPSSPEQQQQCAQIYVQDRYPARTLAWRQDVHNIHDRIRVGYFSADYKDHPVSHLITQLIAYHDRTRFEITGFSFGYPTNDYWRRKLENTFDHFIDVRTRTDEEITALARELEIDIAIDLNGHTMDGRTAVFALRCAPIQVNYLGYIGTMGADYIDYIIGDPTVIPEQHKQYFCERIVYLPHSYQVNDSTKEISERQYSCAELGLPDNAFVFCCFNNNFKITPDVFDIWMRLLKKVDGSVLWLSEGGASATRNLRVEAEKRGILSSRLVFAPRISPADNLARYRAADLFLDTLYYNAGATASDALWAGLPVLTCLGNTFAGRMAASLLNAIDLPELITRSHTDYESMALQLATEPERLAAIRLKLAANISTRPLFDTARFTCNIEAAYVKMYERYQAGLPPDHIVVDA